jgi:hypothetical protein
MKLLATYSVLVFLAGLSAETHAQQTFEKYIDGGNTFYCYSMTETADGGFLCGALKYYFEGSSPMLVRLDANGNLIWVKYIGTFDSTVTFHGATSCPGLDSGILVTTETYNFGQNKKQHLIFYDQNGKEIWQTSIVNILSQPGSYYSLDLTRDTLARSYWMIQDHSLVKLAEDGKVIWARSCLSEDTNATFGPLSLAVLKDGILLAGGTRYQVDGPGKHPQQGIEMALLSRDGDVLWRKLDWLPDEIDYVATISLANGDYAILGQTFESAAPENIMRFYLARFDSLGEMKWDERIDAFEQMTPSSIAEATNGDLVVLGSIWTNYRSMQKLPDSLIILRASPKGEKVTISAMAIPHIGERAGDIIRTRDGGFAISGELRDSVDLYTSSLLVMKLDSSLSGCFFYDVRFSMMPVGDVMAGSMETTEDTSLKNADGDLKPPEDRTFSAYDICSIVSVKNDAMVGAPFSLRPNPIRSNSLLTLHIDGSDVRGNAELLIYDQLGKVIKKEKIDLSYSKEDISFEMPDCPAGVYYFELKNEVNSKILYRSKFVKED